MSTASKPIHSVDRDLRDASTVDALADEPSIRCATLYERHGKRAFDVVVASFALVVLFPLILIVAIGVRALLGSPVLFRQQRLGKNAVPFEILKFRSMKHDRRRGSAVLSGEDRRRQHKSDSDPRHTAFGRFIRKYGLDELPQLVNVVRGEMSLVGPRPELPAVADKTGITAHPRHLVRPGLTGPWQLSGDRQANIADNVHLDEEYISSVTLRKDVRLLFATPIMLLGQRSG